jgi:hypothetical protein
MFEELEEQMAPAVWSNGPGEENQEEAFEKHCRPRVHDRQTGPVQRLLGQPVQLDPPRGTETSNEIS